MKASLVEIEKEIERGDAVILTAKEVEQLVSSGRASEVREVDVVTTGTMGIMSGTYAILSFRIARPGEHRCFDRAKMNGIPVVVGPCPNESLGIIDVMVMGTKESEDRHRYGGSHLFRDLVEGKNVHVEAISNNGRSVEVDVDIGSMLTAKMMSSRNCFRNYRAFVNPSNEEFSSIFHTLPFPSNCGGLAFSGCGRYNPIQNDPTLETIGVGTKLLFNGAEGFAISNGTRSSEKYPNLMTVADMPTMDPVLMGGYMTAVGVECLSSYAVPIPIFSEAQLLRVMKTDSDVPLSIGDIHDRHKIGESDYGSVWSGTNEIITMDVEKCIRCAVCDAAAICPTDAIQMDDDSMSINKGRCINCGVCTYSCPQHCFVGELGSVTSSIEGHEKVMPVVCRNSNREGAVRTMNDLKRRIEGGSFTLTAKVADIRP
ncbi:MAG: ferredoxin [Methanomassiliicoccales archaeon PtaU1.Bin124]|nr:MAG: ferredoxin [Methanomassiliicoccales archaeon PtaU1.Bin124]